MRFVGPDFSRNGERWLAWCAEVRRATTDLYGAEPQLCQLVLGISFPDLLHRLNAIEAECRRYAPTEADAIESERATV